MPVEIKNLNGQVIYVYPGDTLVGADLSKQALNGKNLEYADFRAKDLTGATLERTPCRGADFSGATLNRVLMEYVDAREAKFLSGTNFTDANIERGNFRKADFTGSFSLAKVKRDFQAKFSGATMPDGQVAPVD